MDANEPTPGTEADVPASSKGSLLVWAVVGLVSAGGGAAVATLVTSTAAAPAEETSAAHTHEPLITDQTMFVPFSDVTVNLNEGRMNRYLRIKLSLQIEQSQEKVVTEAVERQRLVLRNWLISHLSDKELDEIRGAAGQNMLRREIRDQFNTVLFSDGRDRVFDVLFEEFNVQ